MDATFDELPYHDEGLEGFRHDIIHGYTWKYHNMAGKRLDPDRTMYKGGTRGNVLLRRASDIDCSYS